MAPLRAPSGPLLNAQTGRADQDSIESMTTEHRDLNQLVALNPIAIATFRRYLDGGCAPHVIRPCCHRSSSTRATPGADGLQQLLAYNRPLFLQPAVLHQLRILQCQCFPLRSRQSRSRTRPPFPRILRAIFHAHSAALASAFHDAGIAGKRDGLLWL